MVCDYNVCIGSECEHYNENEEFNCKLKAEEKKIQSLVSKCVVCNTNNFNFN